jgi:general stress protein YciG
MADKGKGSNKGSMTVAEAGRKGGETVRDERGREFYEEIGKKGGETVKAERGREFYEEIGKKGGETVKAERGPRSTRDRQEGRRGGQGRAGRAVLRGDREEGRAEGPRAHREGKRLRAPRPPRARARASRGCVRRLRPWPTKTTRIRSSPSVP